MRLDYEANRAGCSFVAFVALIGCLFGSWLAFGVFVVVSVEYMVTMYCETIAERKL